MKITRYSIKSSKINTKLRIACISDLHARKCEKVIEALGKINPDIILLAGDILEVSNGYMKERNKVALEFLKETVLIAPTYYCFGNHEIYFSHTRQESNRVSDKNILKENLNIINSIGIHLVNDSFINYKSKNGEDIYIGGLICGFDMNPKLCINKPNLDFIEEFHKLDSFKILICHYPHYYDTYLKSTSFDLIVSGHAHGGQWRIFNRGLYAPHQGIFPKYTSGIYDDRFIINRGAVNNSKPIPRFFNPTEVLQIDINI